MYLIALLGPTGIGKTDISIRLAEWLNAPIISSDSRQFYRELKIGTAAPSNADLQRAKHYFIGTHSITDLYNCGQYELDVIALLDNLFTKNRAALLVGGSMMYIDAVCNGIDDIPTIDEHTRNFWLNAYNEKGKEFLCAELLRLDPEYYQLVDLDNVKRVLHALEICSITGGKYSDIRTGQKKQRNFNIIKIGLELPREELYERINLRVDKMMADGLENEARQFYEFRHLNTLNTVGYKELFEYFDGNISLEKAVELTKRDTRHYAKRQMSWFKRDKDIAWFSPNDEKEIKEYINSFFQ
ncbi:MAG: tRNA (adenosine(37)-N6)-dimethylallyltransferase MiaA [Paludibacter sp.]|jgi:tRNA dimethylallyltransferase|nr:tRNA (adenosine(37)-N6)-dimethylallyltransferase MiaA [Paludibacter sp.]